MVLRKKIAVIGSGIAGLAAAWGTSRFHDVILFEANGYLGGHANTVTIGDTCDIPIDTGFIVFNEPNYPNFSKLMSFLDVQTRLTKMSFSVSLDNGTFEYSAGNLAGFVGITTNIGNKRYRDLISGFLKLYGPYRLERNLLSRDLSIGELLRARGFTEDFIRDHVLPMTAAIWSSSIKDADLYPADPFITFFRNHRLFSLFKRPSWKTICGGSKEYIRRLVANGRFEVRKNCKVIEVRRLKETVQVLCESGSRMDFDEVVLANHANEALAILCDASVEERRILSSFRYSKNVAILHEDVTQMPSKRKFWSSWNYIRKNVDDSSPVFVTYWMNKLHGLQVNKQFFVTLNPVDKIDEKLIKYETEYSHPVFDWKSIEAANQSRSLQGVNRSWFCGSYMGDGFHEDGLQAGLWVADKLGFDRKEFAVVPFDRLPKRYRYDGEVAK